jgi:hypothetical protein
MPLRSIHCVDHHTARAGVTGREPSLVLLSDDCNLADWEMRYAMAGTRFGGSAALDLQDVGYTRSQLV